MVANIFLLFVLPVFFFAGAGSLHARELIPFPTQHFVDTAGWLNPYTVNRLNNELGQFERDTSNVVIIVICPELPPGEISEQFSNDSVDTWGDFGNLTPSHGVRQENFVVVIYYVKNNKFFIETGYGLEGALPDAECRMILKRETDYHFSHNEREAAFEGIVNDIMAATKHEYAGTGMTNYDKVYYYYTNIRIWLVDILLTACNGLFLYMIAFETDKWYAVMRFVHHPFGWWSRPKSGP